MLKHEIRSKVNDAKTNIMSCHTLSASILADLTPLAARR